MSKFITDPQDPFDGLFDTAWAEVYTSFLPPALNSSGNRSTSAPLEILATPVLTSEAVESSSAQNGPTSLVALTSGGIIINLLFDAAAMAAPASFRAGIQQAASILTSAISDKITVNIKIDYSGTGGGAAAGPDSGLFESYTSVKADLINNATPGDTIFNALPNGSSIQGQSNVAVWNAQLKLWGLLGANDTTTDDGSATFATDINSNVLVGVALHELTHAMGRVPYGPPYGSQPDIFDLFRFTSPGTQLIAGGNTAPAAYFSVDGGNTKLADFGQNSDPSDFFSSGVQGPNDPFNEFYTGSTSQTLTTVDKELLDALGFHIAPPVTTVIEAFGSTKLVEVGNNFYLNSISSGSGPELKYGGAVVVADQFGAWTPIGAEQTAGGYDVAWKIPGADQYTVWSADSNGNYLSNIIGVVSGVSSALESVETTFHQDLNGDGTIGVFTTVIEAFGSTSLVGVSNNFYLDSIGSGSGPELNYGGAAVVAGQFGAWTPIGAEQTAGGFDVAWKIPGADQYTVWSADSNGNYISNIVGVVSGVSSALESLETTFHQDLNGDGTIGVFTTVIEAFGSTSLVGVSNNFYLDSMSSGTGPELKYGGPAVVAGQFGGWTPIGAEQAAGGYDVAWKIPGADQYTVWNTDSSGNYLSNLIPAVSGSSAALEALETTFHQDLNGDGTIGVRKVVMQTDGSTALTEVGNNFYLYSGGTGPELKYAGAVVTAGEFGGWTPIGAVQVSSGYDVAWKDPGTGLYTVWGTDSNGNYQLNLIPAVSGASTALESFETTFHQDLNGDGVIGIPPSPTSATLATAGANSDSVTFTGSPGILTLETPSAFSGHIVGFTGDGTFAGSDQIDLPGMNYSTMHSNYTSSTGVLDLNDGTSTADLQFVGNYSQDSFKFAGSGGLVVYALPTAGQPPPANAGEGPAAAQVAAISPLNVSVAAGQDTFVFAPNFGQVNIANFKPATDTIQISHSVFANVSSLLAATHDDAHGNAIISDAAHDTITIQNVTTAQLLAHQSDFHFV
jgi:serralysin